MFVTLTIYPPVSLQSMYDSLNNCLPIAAVTLLLFDQVGDLMLSRRVSCRLQMSYELG